jgi:hypothetical protein
MNVSQLVEYATAILERLNTIIEQQSDIIALLKAKQAEKKPAGSGPYLQPEGNGE